MSCRLWLTLGLIIYSIESTLMVRSSSSVNSLHGNPIVDRIGEVHIYSFADCFYEKRLKTSLHGHNERHDHWLSEFDCFDRCVRTDAEKCRSFEHWRSNHPGLCVRANISLADDPSNLGNNSFVDYHEIHCRQDATGRTDRRPTLLCFFTIGSSACFQRSNSMRFIVPTINCT